MFYCSYNNTIGVFKVPSGGNGLYYFSTYLLVEDGHYAYFNIVVNDVLICSAYGDGELGGDHTQARCNVVVDVAEGKMKI